jgi:hypothetical protein
MVLIDIQLGTDLDKAQKAQREVKTVVAHYGGRFLGPPTATTYAERNLSSPP